MKLFNIFAGEIVSASFSTSYARPVCEKVINETYALLRLTNRHLAWTPNARMNAALFK